MTYYDDDYDRYDAAYDAAMDAREEVIQRFLRPLVEEEFRAVEELAWQIEDTGEDQPHPWTWCRHLVWVWETEGEDAMRELLEEENREQAEGQAEDWYYDNTPCCNDFHCPCGNSNNYRG